MKPSQYNIFMNLEGGGKLAFNCASATLAEIYSDDYHIVQKMLSGPQTPANPKEQEILSALIEGGYLVEDGVDELEFLKVKNRTRRFDKSTFFLTIAPTLACNFRCEYCFENQRKERMSEETEKALLVFSDKQIKRAETVVVTWFGGEPTLCLPTIERIHAGLKELADKYGVAFDPSSIVTNGYLLDGKMAERLKAAGVEDAQVTLDGPREIHDTRRKLHNGGGTFDKILANLAEASKIMRIVVRVNVDKKNFASSFRIMDEFRIKGILDDVRLYFAQVEKSEGVCADIRDHCLSTEEFSLGQVDMYQTLIKGGFYQIEYPSTAPGGHCGADTDGSYVVAPSGDLFKCWEEIAMDKSRSVGNVHEENVTPQQDIYQKKYLAWDPFERRKCRECEILAICMGGCPHHSMNSGDKEIGSCCSWKYNLREMLRLRYQCDLLKQAKE